MGKMLRMCLNWKVLGAIGLIGLGIWVLAPGLLSAAVPILLLALCPLSMLVMMWSMKGEQQSSPTETDSPTPSHEPRLSELKAELARKQAESERIAGLIARQEAEDRGLRS